MARVTNRGFQVWDLSSDPYSHTQLAANWDLADSLFSSTNKNIQLVSNLTAGTAGGPASPLNNGDMAMTNTTVDNFPAWTLLRYDGSNWRAVGPVEVTSSLPTQDLVAGRLILLSASASNFPAWTLVRYNGSSWDYAGPLSLVNTGAGATNIVGAQINGDLYVNVGTRGLVLVDRSTATKYRVFINNGVLTTETVT